VAEKRAAKAAYDDWYDNHSCERFPSREDVAKECELRTALGHAERAVVRAAEVLADAPNDETNHGGDGRK
jgi:hypothetical protein